MVCITIDVDFGNFYEEDEKEAEFINEPKYKYYNEMKYLPRFFLTIPTTRLGKGKAFNFVFNAIKKHIRTHKDKFIKFKVNKSHLDSILSIMKDKSKWTNGYGVVEGDGGFVIPYAKLTFNIGRITDIL